MSPVPGLGPIPVVLVDEVGKLICREIQVNLCFEPGRQFQQGIVAISKRACLTSAGCLLKGSF